MNDSLGDRMKGYESAEAGRSLMPLLPAFARLDGRNFSAFTRRLEQPFDKRLSDLMIETATFLVRESNAACGYTQSDEITLAWAATDYDSQAALLRARRVTGQDVCGDAGVAVAEGG